MHGTTNPKLTNKVCNLQFPFLFWDIYVVENAGVSCVSFETGAAIVDRFSCNAETLHWDSARCRDGVNEEG
jgi:hypothetical protein